MNVAAVEMMRLLTMLGMRSLYSMTSV